MSNLNDPFAGFYVDEEEPQPSKELPVDKEETKSDPFAEFYVNEEDDEEEDAKKAAGPYYVPEKSREELSAMSFDEKRQYNEDLKVMREYLQSKGFTKGALSGATLGATAEYIPGLKQEKGELLGGFGETVGATLPVTGAIKLFSYPLRMLAKKSPFFTKSLTALADITSLGLAGGTYHTAETVVKKGELPSSNDVLKHGFEWMTLDAALRGTLKASEFAVNLTKASKNAKKPEWKVVNDVLTELKDQGVDISTSERTAAKALSIIEDMAEGKPKERSQVREVKQKKFKEMDDFIIQLAEPVLPVAQEPTLSVNSLVENVEQKAVRQRIDSVGRRTMDDAELGREVQDSVNRAREEAKGQYRPFYDAVEEGAVHITTNPRLSTRRAGELIQALEEINTRATGDTTVISSLENILEDLGYVVQRARAPKGKKGPIELIIQDKPAPLSRLLQLGRKLNEIVKYDSLDKLATDKLKRIVTDLKQDIRSALGAADPDLLAAFELAEEAFAVNAEKFGRDSIRKILKGEALELIPRQLESATGLNDLRLVVQPSVMKNVERQILEKMNKMNHGKAEEFLRKVRSGLSSDSQAIADQIIRSKVPINKQSIRGRVERMHEAIDEDLATAMNTGMRPNKVLDLWQNPRGQKLVKDALKTHPQKKELIDYLQKQTLQDMARTIVNKDGTIDVAKLNELMKNTALRNNLEQLGGKEAVKFFEDLSTKANNLKKNAQELVTEKLGKPSGEKGKPTIHVGEKGPKITTGERGQGILKRQARVDYPLAAKIERFFDFLGVNGRITLNLFTLMKFGLVKGMAAPIATRIIQKMATSPRVRKAFNKAAQRNLSTEAFLAAIEELDQALDEE